MIKPKYEVLTKPGEYGGGGPAVPDHRASAMKYYADVLLYLDEKRSARGNPGVGSLADKITWNYDAKHDVLYIGIGDRRNSYGDEVRDGVILLLDADTNAVTGLTILDFQKRQPGGGAT